MEEGAGGMEVKGRWKGIAAVVEGSCCCCGWRWAEGGAAVVGKKVKWICGEGEDDIRWKQQ